MLSDRKNSKAKPQFGLGFRRSFSGEVFLKPHRLDFFEVISENYFYLGGQSRYWLKKLRDKYPLAIHGVSLSIAASSDPGTEYLEKLKALVEEYDPFLVTDHLCVTQSKGREIHDLLPISLNEKTLDLVSRRVEFVQKYLGRRIGLENPSQYLQPKYDSMTLAEFFNKLNARTGCGLLLDVNNLWVNEVNLGQNPVEFMQSLEPGIVMQRHLAGASESENGFLIDTHDQPMSERSWEIYRKSCELFPAVPSLLEWDEKIPAFETLLAEVSKAKKIYQSVARKKPVIEKQTFKQVSPQYSGVSLDSGYNHDLYLEEFGDLIFESQGVAENDERLLRHFESTSQRAPRSWGIQVYVSAFYLRHKEQLESIFGIFQKAIGKELWGQLVEEYLLKHPPEHFSIDETGARFKSFVEKNLEQQISESNIEIEYPVSFLVDILTFEQARFDLLGVGDDLRVLHNVELLQKMDPHQWHGVEFGISLEHKILNLRTKISPFLRAHFDSASEVPELTGLLLESETMILLRHPQRGIEYYALTGFEEALLKSLQSPKTVEQISQVVAGGDEKSYSRIFENLIPWIQRGYVKKPELIVEKTKFRNFSKSKK